MTVDRGVDQAGELLVVDNGVVPPVSRTTDFTEVLSAPGVREVFEQRSRVGVMAYHGGGLEAMTDVIADAVAERADASLYAVVQPPTMRLHFPSTCVDPQASPALQAFLDHVDVVVTIHGYGHRGLFGSLLLGGQNRTLAHHIGGELRRTLPAYDIVTDIEAIPKKLRGMHDANPVNLPPQQGVQIELPPRVRGSSPLWWDWEGPGLTPHTEWLIEGLGVALASWSTTTSATR